MTKIIGISGRKQSGKSTSGNFILSLFIAKMEIAKSVSLNEKGEIVVSDLMGKKEYTGVFDATWAEYETDFIRKQCYQRLAPLCKIYTFADILKKDICMNILGLTKEQCYGTDEDKNSLTELVLDNHKMSARDVMQYIGTDIFRKCKPNVWVDATINKIKKDKPEIAIITDCRFPNEIELIKNHNGKVLRLTRNPYNSDHISETILDQKCYDWSNFDHIINNDHMTIYEQCKEIQNIIQELVQL